MSHWENRTIFNTTNAVQLYAIFWCVLLVSVRYKANFSFEIGTALGTWHMRFALKGVLDICILLSFNKQVHFVFVGMKIDHLNFNLIAVIALPQLVLFIKIYNMSRYRRVLKILVTVKYKYFLYFASQFASVIPLSQFFSMGTLFPRSLSPALPLLIILLVWQHFRSHSTL